MEKLKKARKPIRALLTRTCNDIETLLNPEYFDEVQLTAKDGKLDELLQKVQTLDQQILDLYLEEDNEKGYEDEIMAIDVYTSEVRLARAKINKVFRNIEAANRTERPPSEYSTASGECKQKRKFKLPKIELLKFSGKLIDWLSWWSQFEKIHSDDELHTTDKFEYLRQAMDKNTRAKDIVDGYPATEDNYPKVIKALKDRFGKKKLLIQVYVRGLFQMGLQNLNKEVQIVEFFDKLVSHVRSLETLGVTLEQAALFLYPMVESSLPEDVHIAWQRSPLYEKDGSTESPPMNELDYLFQFLQQEVERGEQRQLIKTSFSSKDSSKKDTTKRVNTPSTATAASLFNGQSQDKSIGCIFCDKAHESKDCAATEFWSTDDMKKKIQEKKSCFQCLKQNHTAKTCKSFVKCHVCSKRHLTIMCPEIKEKKLKKTTDSSAGTNFDCSHDVLLKTIMVHVMVNSKKKLARVLFDDGSQRSYITTSLIKSLDSKPFKQEGMRNILFDGSRTEYQKLNNHKISVQSLTGTGTMSLIVREKSILGGRVSRIPKGFWLKEFINKEIQFNDVAESKESISAEVDIVIGSDYWGLVVNGNKETLPCGLTAFETIWGWTLCGIVPTDSQSHNIISMFIAEEEVNKLWSLDVIGIKDPIEKLTEIQEEMAVMEMFKKTVKRKEDGRYVVKLPWVNELPKIPNNKKVAMARLMSATKKLNFNNQYETYDEIFNAWSNEGIIEKVEIVNSENGHYLPHRPIFKDSVTTPVRPVFDASCKTYINISLNDCMYKGPNFIDSLPAKLMRFRMKLVGVLSDIRKAFLMIEVDKKDREYLQFLWWEDDTKTKALVLRHCRIVFGLKCSPFLLAAVLEEHLSSIPNSKKETADELKKALYIDNCVTSLDSIEQYEQFKKIAMEIMAEGKFELRQWEYSSPPKLGDISVPMETKVLGLIWDKGMDTLRIQTPKLEEFDKLTKRNIASALHKFFDPLGMVSPALISPKIMLQQAWKHKASWDSELPAAWKEQFNKWCAEASLLNEIKIPRHCTISNSTHQLHTFTDASQNAYSAVVFLRSEHEGEIRIQLIQSKSRVSPLAKATIPRLELMGCLIGSRLAQHSTDAMELQDLEKYYWSDSKKCTMGNICLQ